MDNTENRICSKLLPKGQLAKDAPGQIHPWCDTLEAHGIESVVPQVLYQKTDDGFCSPKVTSDQWQILWEADKFSLASIHLQCYHSSK